MDKAMFTIQTYLSRRRNLKTRIDSGIAVFMGNDESPLLYLWEMTKAR